MLAIYKYIISLLGIMILYYYIVVLYGAPKDRKSAVKFICTAGSISAFLMLIEGYIGTSYRALAVYIVMLVTAKYFFKLNIVRAVLCIIFYSISLVIGDTFVAFLLVKMYRYTEYAIKSSLLLSFTSDLLIYGTSAIIIIIVMMVTQPKEIPNKFSRKISIRSSAYMLFTLIVIAINNSLYMQYIHLISNTVVLTNIIITWVYLILSLYINFTARDLAIKEQEYNEQQDYINTIDNLVNDYRRLKHNHANTIYSIYGYIEKQDLEGLNQYFREVMDETRRISNNTLLALQKIKIYSVFGLLWAKVNEAEASGIRSEVEVSNVINEIDVKMSELCEILGNYLDNAIDGARQSTDKKIKISIFEDEDYITLCISNSYDEEPDMSRINEKGYSTKGENRGFGLAITEEILSKHKNILHNTYFENKTFTQELNIKK